MRLTTLLLLTLTGLSAAEPTPPAGMAYIPGGTYLRGEDRPLGGDAEYPEEAPVHQVTVSSFFMDITEVTNADFLKFTTETGYKTQAERGLSKEDFPEAPEDQLVAGAMVFSPPEDAVEKWQPGAEWQWWKFVKGANWRHPQGPGSDIHQKMEHPVVCITKEDAEAYCKWAGKRLPTEAEWERAARGKLKHAIFSWGNHPKPDDKKWPANTFQGEFPYKNLALDGFVGTAPVKSFEPNGFGLYDMGGNVWEICSDLYRPDYYQIFSENPVKDPKGPTADQAISQLENDTWNRSRKIPAGSTPFHPLARLWVSKGGSFLCHHTYCLRYRPAARHYAESLSPTNHAGFRCVKDVE